MLENRMLRRMFGLTGRRRSYIMRGFIVSFFIKLN
jgi:hypothetical protein